MQENMFNLFKNSNFNVSRSLSSFCLSAMHYQLPPAYTFRSLHEIPTDVVNTTFLPQRILLLKRNLLPRRSLLSQRNFVSLIPVQFCFQKQFC